jgi:hypothetical protein
MYIGSNYFSVDPDCYFLISSIFLLQKIKGVYMEGGTFEQHVKKIDGKDDVLICSGKGIS